LLPNQHISKKPCDHKELELAATLDDIKHWQARPRGYPALIFKICASRVGSFGFQFSSALPHWAIRRDI
jgi:hypothetical protein